MFENKSRGSGVWFKQVPEETVPSMTKFYARLALADCCRERDLGELKIVWVLPENEADTRERAAGDVWWEAWHSDAVKSRGFMRLDDPSKIYVKADLSEDELRYIIAHETYHVWDHVGWGSDGTKRAQMESEAERYGLAYVAACRDGAEWDRPTRQQYMGIAGVRR